MKFKLLLFATMFVLCSILCVSAETIEVETLNAENITYYSATLNGNIPYSNSTISSYGIEIWSDDTAAVKNQIGSGSISGQFTETFYLLDNTTYSYRAYIKDKSSSYHYGTTKTFKTATREMKESPEIDFNINVDSLETINFADTPNKYFLNNLILNNQDTLKIIAGNNFDGVEGVIGAGDENIFINQYFINKYYTDPVLKSLLTVFDGAVYNRDEFIWNGITSVIPDFVANGIYNITPDKLKSTLNTIYGDMGVKRFNGAINSVISNDYTSSDKRTFGYDKANYRIINALTDSTKATNKLVKNYQEGKETIVEGIEDYQGYYLGTIAPQYYNAQNNFLQMNRYLTSNSKNMTSNEIAECLDNMSEYSQEISKYEKYDFIDETASKWKINMEYSYYGKGVTDALKKVGKPLDLATSSIATLKTLEQVRANKEQLQGTLERLQDTTTNNKLSITLDDYLYKMEDGFGSFLAETAANVYSAYGKSVVKKAVNETVEKSAKKLVSAENKVYAGQAVDSAIAKANYLLIAADVGGMFSEAISGTKTYLEKAIEAKYLWNIENESKEVLQRDLIKYGENQTEENAIAVLNDLYWIKALKLREITVVKDLYKANGSSWLSLADKSLAELSDGVNELYINQRDALINASLTETKYTSEVLTLENGETYTVVDYNNETGNNGSILTSNGTTMLKNADARLSGGVNLKSGSTLVVMASDTTIYIPFVTMESGANFIIKGGNVIIGEFNQNNGTISIGGSSNVVVCGDVVIRNTLNLNNSTIKIKGKLWCYSNGAVYVENSTVEVGGSIQVNGKLDVGNGRVECDGKIWLTSEGCFYMQNENAYVLVGGEFEASSYAPTANIILTAGTLELKGDFTRFSYPNKTDFIASGTHKTILSGTDTQTVSAHRTTFNILKSINDKVDFKYAGANINKIESSVFNMLQFNDATANDSTITVNGILLHSGNFKTNNSIISANEMETKGYLNLNNSTVKIKGKLWCYSNGAVYVENSTVEVGGSIQVNGKLDVGNGRVECDGKIWLTSEGCFYMQNENAYVLVGGEFEASSYAPTANIILTAGTLELKGDFTRSSYPNKTDFIASGTHKTILSGTDTQTVSAHRTTFNILIKYNSSATLKSINYKYLFDKMPYVFKLNTNTKMGNLIKILDSTIQNQATSQIESLGTLSKSGYYFKGWYLDENYTIPLTAENDIITSDMTLYAKWAEPMLLDNVSYSSESNEISLNISLDEELESQNGIIIIAVYDDAKLITTHHTNAEETVSHTFKNVPVTENGYTVKAFCWSDFETLIPLCNAVSKEV